MERKLGMMDVFMLCGGVVAVILLLVMLITFGMAMGATGDEYLVLRELTQTCGMLLIGLGMTVAVADWVVGMLNG